ncbi:MULTISPECIES: cold-inducible protein YdjO-related protein [Paenibacillus]|uniref:cold-inducible protein YdjO-related protein n=1 Tax=Paenibacillus TaxID=44249 RepID=UPI0022B91CF8|nr:cold-inducible protein YdjO-related protein [Paenibacillus caseinilyticus]MCZ8519147.1 cold-inducible protein YdjO-related protein [Paenibacillus caseinilyticus]
MDVQQEETKPELKPTVIWKCKNADCKAWVREEFAAAEYPECPICKGPTIRSYKHLPAVAKAKKPRKKASK